MVTNGNKPGPSSPYPQELKLLLDRVQTGDPAALPALEDVWQKFPELIARFGDLAGHVEQALLGLLAGPNQLARAAIQQHLAMVKSDLGVEEAPPLERLLISRLALSWLQAHQADLEVAGKVQTGQTASAALSFAMRRQQQAHTRVLSAARTLALVRKLLRPAHSPIHVAARLRGDSELPSSLQKRCDSVAVGN